MHWHFCFSYRFDLINLDLKIIVVLVSWKPSVCGQSRGTLECRCARSDFSSRKDPDNLNHGVRLYAFAMLTWIISMTLCIALNSSLPGIPT